MVAKFGFGAIALGATALTLTVIHFYGGPFASQQSAGVSLGELTAEIAQSAKRAVLNQPQPAPDQMPWTIDRSLSVLTAVLAVAAIVLAVIGYVVREPKRVVVGGVALGLGALLFQFFVWYAIALLGVLLIFALLNSLGGFFDGLFG